MPEYEAPCTIAHHRAKPYFHARPLDGVRCSEIAVAIASYKNAAKAQSPQSEAIEFYCLNHLSGMIRKHFTPYEVLPGWTEETLAQYDLCLANQTRRLLYYMVLICTREARHLHPMSSTFWSTVQKNFGASIAKFFMGHSSEGGIMASFLKEPPDALLLDYMRAISHLYYKGKWSSSYGGPKWGVITDCVVRFLAGETSAEVMADTAYTLAHNTAPMFNKGMLYSNDYHYMIKILDVQRSGQIPELVLESSMGSFPHLVVRVKTVKQELGNIGPSVDWDKVMALGAVGSYKNKVKPIPPKPPAPPKWLPKGAVILGNFQITPSESVVQYDRVALAEAA